MFVFVQTNFSELDCQVYNLYQGTCSCLQWLGRQHLLSLEGEKPGRNMP